MGRPDEWFKRITTTIASAFRAEIAGALREQDAGVCAANTGCATTPAACLDAEPAASPSGMSPGKPIAVMAGSQTDVTEGKIATR